jgi:hypothetical protein
MTLTTTCISASLEDLQAHDNVMQDITLQYAIRKIGVNELQQVFGDIYTWGRGKRNGLKLKNDWAVNAVSSMWNGKPCITIFHSRIHYIFQ